MTRVLVPALDTINKDCIREDNAREFAIGMNIEPIDSPVEFGNIKSRPHKLLKAEYVDIEEISFTHAHSRD